MFFLVYYTHTLKHNNLVRVWGDSLSNIKLMERDYVILREIDKWRVITGKHICSLCGFTGQRACDRRLRKLIEAGFITRKKILYGVPGLYFLTSSGRNLIQSPEKSDTVRVEQIIHDIAILDTAIYFHHKYGIDFSCIVTEKQLHKQDGFGVRCHRPDFVFTKGQKSYCVEIELNLKSSDRFLKNIISNFTDYDGQIWIVPDMHCKIASFLLKQKTNYPNIKVFELQEVKQNAV